MAQQAIQKSLEKLKEQGLKHTKKREDLIRLFSQEDRYLSAKMVQQMMEGDYPSLSFDTIYRNLYSFVDIGILEMTEWNNERMFRIACGDHGHHHHFICQQCGSTKQLEMCPLDFFQQQLGGSAILSHRFEIFGICENCLGAPAN